MQHRRTIGLVIGQLSAGGAEGQLALLARALHDSRYEPRVYCLSGQTRPIGPELERDGVRVRAFPGPQPMRVVGLARALREDNVDLVHAWLFIANSYAWLANRGRRPLITSARNCKRQGLLHDTVNRFAFRSSAAIVANSHQVKDYIAENYAAPRERIAVIHNGVDVDHFHPAAEGEGGETLIVGIGRLVRQKDPELFLRAAARVAARHPEARFAFVGEGPLRPRLEAAIAAAGVAGRVSLPGATRDVAGALRRARLFWLTSAWEGLPNVVMEAMASGVPAIAADVGGTRELIRDGVDGYLVRAGDEAAFVQHTLDVLGDAPRHTALARAAREHALEFSIGQMVHAMQRLYDDVLSSPAS